METNQKVIHLLNDLNLKKQIPVWRYDKMLPDQKKLQLAYLYFIPKPHKVNEFHLRLNDLLISFQ